MAGSSRASRAWTAAQSTRTRPTPTARSRSVRSVSPSPRRPRAPLPPRHLLRKAAAPPATMLRRQRAHRLHRQLGPVRRRRTTALLRGSCRRCLRAWRRSSVLWAPCLCFPELSAFGFWRRSAPALGFVAHWILISCSDGAVLSTLFLLLLPSSPSIYAAFYRQTD